MVPPDIPPSSYATLANLISQRRNTPHPHVNRAGMLEVLERSELQSPDVRATLESTSALRRRLENEADTTACMVELIDRIELRDDGIRVTLKIRVPCSRAGVQTSSILSLSRFVPLKMKRRGVETRIIIAAGNEPPREVDSALLKAVARARVWFDELASGRVHSLAEIARNEGIGKRYVERLSRLAFVTPAIVEAICQGQTTRRAQRRDAAQPHRSAARMAGATQRSR
jgi:hypothetical protein